MGKRALVVLILSLAFGCGGRMSLGTTADAQKGGKGTSVVNPVTPDHDWLVYRGSQLAEAPLKAGDWINLQCTSCGGTIWITVWTLSGGQQPRTIHFNKPLAPSTVLQVAFEPTDKRLLVLWSTHKLDELPDANGIESFKWYEDPRQSAVKEDGQLFGQLLWGTILNDTLAWRAGSVMHLAGPR